MSSEGSANSSSPFIKGVAVFTHDTKLLRAISSTLADSSVNGDGETYAVIQETEDFGVADTVSASVFDLDLVDNDLDSAAEILSYLSSAQNDYPLFLVGQKAELKKALNRADIKAKVARSFAKPVIGNQVKIALGMVIDRAKAKNANGGQVNAPKSSSIKGMFFAIGAVVLLVLCYGMYTQFFYEQDDSAETEFRSLDTLVQDLNRTEAQIQSSSAFTEEGTKLTQQAQAAIDDGRILSPEQNSALHFYRSALDINRFDSNAEKRKELIVGQVKLAFLIARDQNDFVKAEQLHTLLSELDPFNVEVRRMAAALSDTKARVEAAEQEDKERDSSAELEVKESGFVVRNSSQKPPRIPQTSVQQPVTETASIKQETSQVAPQTERITEKLDVVETQEAKLAVKQTAKPVAPKAIKPENIEPKLLKRVEADYPRRAFKLDIQGWVEFEYRVDAQGKTTGIRVVAENPKRIFTKSALKALEQWEYQPATNADGDAVESDVLNTKFNFSLNQ